MTKFFHIVFCILAATNLLSQERMQVNTNTDVEHLVKNVFVKGNCKNVSNINFIGDDNVSLGEFNSGTDAIDFNKGILITTGKVENASGPNITIDSGFELNGEIANDPDLNQISTGNLYDVRGIEFDFVPLDNLVEFRYVFASEEYCEFVDSDFNDLFGFFVSGPGINGPFSNNAINVAKLNGTDIDVSINNVNHIRNSNFYTRNELAHDALACELDFNSELHDLIEYDGFTIPLTATIPVIPCETYHIRLVLSDVADPILDSAVFLEAKSFDLGEKGDFYAEVPGNDVPVAYEGCIDGQFVFTRNETTNLNESCTMNFRISPESEAINGEDFEEIPLSITIPEGEINAILPITMIGDNMIEGPETLILELQYDCDCFEPIERELIINEAIDLAVSLDDRSACDNQTFILSPEITGGVPPYEFLWNTNETSDSIEVNISEASTFSLSVIDGCGNNKSVNANIGIQDVPSASLSGEFDLCAIQDIGIPIQLEGSAPWSINFSIDGTEQSPIENIESNPFFLEVYIDGIYELTFFNDTNCEGIAIGSATITNNSIQVQTNVIQPTCINTNDGSIELINIEASSPYFVSWNIETENDFLIDQLYGGIYTLMIENNEGCIYEETFDIFASANDISDCAPVFIPNIFTPNSNNGNEIFSIYIGPTSGIAIINSMQVFDRWGSLVYEKGNFIPDNGLTGWDGEFNGQEASPGVYVYKVEISFVDGSKRLDTGSISLIR